METKVLLKESVWDYPEVPQVEIVREELKVFFNGLELACTLNGKRVLQWGIPPTYYFPAEDVRLGYLHKTDHHSYCDEKGFADYWTVQVAERSSKNAAWAYLDSPEAMTPRGYIAFYAHLMDACFIDDEQISAPPWVWIGGWVTSQIEGPFLTREQCSRHYAKKGGAG